MTVLTVIVAVFLVLECTNVLALYFAPGSDKANALGVFGAWERSKQDPAVHDLVRYLAWWVAGTKLIFILLMGAILVVGDDRMKVVAVGALILSILSFWWRLFPLMRRMDRRGEIRPRGYSTGLGWMIGGFVVALGVGLGFGIGAM